MALPRVNVNVGEQTLVAANTQIPFVPAVIMKTKSGPIGTVETLTSESQFKALFGDSDYTVPSAYAIQVYLRSYSYVLVTRIANEEEAAFGEGKLTVSIDGSDVDLISVKTKYKTDLFNGKEIKLVYDGEKHKLWFDVSSITGKNTISVKEDFIADTAKADEFEAALNTIIKSINSAELGFELTNLFVGKTAEDLIPTIDAFTAGFSFYVEEGNSGNTTPVDTVKVKAMVDKYDLPEKDIDVMIIPEYSNYEVINYATELALRNNFVVLASVEGDTIGDVKNNISNYNTENRGSLALYYPNVFYKGFFNNKGELQEIPVSIAVLHAYARTDILSKWGAPAGITRGNLTLVNSLKAQLSESMIEQLYDNEIPVNCINEISGKGFIVWGNKTTDTDSGFFDRINVARLVKYVTKNAYDISWNYLFEPITTQVFTDWKLKIEAFLEPIKLNYGITAYEVIMDSTINTEATIAANQLNGIIRIKPQEVAEFINIDFTITDTIQVTVEG